MKGRITLHLLLADCAAVDAVLQGEGLAKIFLTMLPHIMNNPIRLRYSLEFTTGALELLTLLCRMACGHMNRQTLGLEKALLTDRALKGRLSLVTLHVIVHCVLILLDRITRAANKVTVCILLIRVRHGAWSWATPGFNF